MNQALIEIARILLEFEVKRIQKAAAGEVAPGATQPDPAAQAAAPVNTSVTGPAVKAAAGLTTKQS